MKKEIEDAIKKVLKEKNKKIITAQEAMLAELNLLRKEVIVQIAEASTEWQLHYLPGRLKAIEEAVNGWNLKSRGLLLSQTESLWKTGKELVDAPLAISGELGFSYQFLPRSVLNEYQEFAVSQMKKIGPAAMEKIETELRLGIMAEKSSIEVIKAVGKNLKDPSIFGTIAKRAETIVKHENGKIFSKASFERMKQANAVIPGGMQKQWRHAGHPQMPRMSHVFAGGQIVDVDKPFRIGGHSLMFPRDPGAALSEAINCGCDSVPYKKEWV